MSAHFNSIPMPVCISRIALTAIIAFCSHAGNKCTAQIDQTLLDANDPECRYELVAVTKDQKYVVAATDERVCAWERESGNIAVSQSGDFQNIVTNDSCDTIVYWDDANSRLMEISLVGDPIQWKSRVLMTGFEDPVAPMALSNDAKRLACRLSYKETGVIDLQQKSILMRLQNKNVVRAAFSPSGDRISFTFKRSEDAVVSYAIGKTNHVATSAGFLGQASHLQYSSDGKMVAVSCKMSGENSLALLDARTLRPLRGARFSLYSYPEECALDWSDDSRTIAVAGALSSGYSIGVFDAQKLEPLTFLIGNSCSSLAFSNDGSQLFSVSDRDPGTIGWDWQANLRYREATSVFASHPWLGDRSDQYPVELRVAISPDDKTIALAIPSPYSASVKAPLKPTDDSLATAGLDFSRLDDETAYIFFLNAETGKTTKAVVANRALKEDDGSPIGGNLFDRIEFSPNGQTLATLFGDGVDDDAHLVLWDMQSSVPRITMMLKKQYHTWREGWVDLRYTDSGRSLLLLPYDADDHGVQLVDLETSTVTNSLKGDFGPSLLPLSQGQFASGFSTWDCNNGEALYRENTDDPNRFDQLVWTRDNAIVGVRSEHVLGKWSLDTLKLRFPFASHRYNGGLKLYAIAGSPGGELIATGCADSMIRVWQAETGKLLAVLRGHSRAVDALCFSHDGKRVVSASRDGTTRTWEIGDLTSGQNAMDRPALPTHRSFEVQGGAKVTVTFDGPATNAQIREALENALHQLGQPNPVQ